MVIVHYTYQDICTPFVSKIVCMEQETFNAEDLFVVAIVKAETFVGHISHYILLCF